MACAIPNTRLVIVKGDTARLKFTITKADCETPEDLSVFPEIYFTIKRSTQDSDVAAIFRGSLTNGDIELIDLGVAGILEVVIPPSATTQLRTGRPFPWDIELRGDSENIYTPLSGDILTTAESTRA